MAKLITDNDFKQAFFRNPTDAVKKSGFAISEEESTALAKLKPADFAFEVNEKVLGEGTPSSNVECTVSGVKSFKQLGPLVRTKVSPSKEISAVKKSITKVIWK